jgi:hypothetical protein
LNHSESHIPPALKIGTRREQETSTAHGSMNKPETTLDINEPPVRLSGFPFHDDVDDLSKLPIFNPNYYRRPTPEELEACEVTFRNSISIEPAGERPMRQESTSDLSFID